MTCNVFGGTLSLTQSINQSIHHGGKPMLHIVVVCCIEWELLLTEVLDYENMHF